LEFELLYENEYAECYSNKEKGIIACILKAEYVPISDFRKTFKALESEVKKGGYKRFVFDKRSLRTFHQPSMEWYFLEWKTEVFNYGLKEHRKILPDLKWFVKAVEIAKKDLDSRLPDDVRKQLQISYCNSLEEAIS
jgi:hypothetical protein